MRKVAECVVGRIGIYMHNAGADAGEGGEMARARAAMWRWTGYYFFSVSDATFHSPSGPGHSRHVPKGQVPALI